MEINLYLMVHSTVLKFENIWLSSTLIIIRKPNVWRTDGHDDLYIPRLSSSGGIKETVSDTRCSRRVSIACSVNDTFQELWAEILNSDGQQFKLYDQNEHQLWPRIF